MTVYEGSDCILKTAVTWTDFESKLRSSLGTEARFGTNKSVLDIGDGIGYASCCGLITCDWVGAADDENLPSTVVLKIPSFAGLRKLNDAQPEGQKMFNHDEEQWQMMEKSLSAIHNREVAAYEFLEQFDSLLVPKKYYGSNVVDGAGGQLCLEYVENSRMMTFYEEHSVEQVRQVARALGKIQAASLKKEPTAPELQADFFENMGNLWPLETYRGMFKGILEFDSSVETTKLMEKVDSLLPTYHGANLPSTIHKQMGVRPVLVNGDLHTGNVLIDKDSGNVKALIDWQCTHIGVGVEDLHRIAMSALTKEERRAFMPNLLEEMYNSLVKNLDGAEPPYSLETLHFMSDLLFPHCALFLVSIFIAMIKEKDPSVSDEEKEKRTAVKLAKSIGILEDVIDFDIKNKDRMGNLKFKSK